MSEKFFERRPQPSQFPSKLNALPHISGSAPASPTPGPGNQLVPYGGLRAATNPDMDSERYRQLESRINISERSNRALLEEVVRLQSELKSSIRRNDELARQEQLSRQQIEHSLRTSNELVSQLSTRLKRTEDKVQDERSALSALMNQHKSVEQAIMGGQQDLINRRDLQSTKIDEIRNELDEVLRIKDQLERMSYQMADDMRQIKSKMDTQSVELVSAVSELKQKSKRLEDDNRQQLDSMRKQNETHNVAEQTTQQLRAQVENRLSELRDVVVDLRTKHDSEVQERRVLEQQIQVRLSDVQASIRDQGRKRDEAMHAMDAVQRERDHNTDTERLRLQTKIAEIAEEVSKKILQKEMKIREENAQKFSQIEQALVHEQDMRQKFEKDSREDSEKRWESLKKLNNDELQLVKEQIKNEKKKSTETLHTLNRAVNLVEKQMEEHKKQQDKLLSAEIKSRKQTEHQTQHKVDDIEEKLRLATSTLQQAIGSTAGEVNSQGQKIRREVKEELEASKQAEIRHLADLDARLVALTHKLAQSEDLLEAKIAATDLESADDDDERMRQAEINEEGKKIQDHQLQEMLGDYQVFKDVTDRAVDELKKQNDKLPARVYELEEKSKMDKATMETQLAAEAESRRRQISELKDDIDNIKPSTPKEASNKEIEACQSSIRKLAESIQTVKTVLGMKIQSEQKLRVEEIESLQEELDNLRDLIIPLLKHLPKPKLFIKPDDITIPKEKAEQQALDINKWNIYTVCRWLKWKKSLSAYMPKRPVTSSYASSDDNDSDDDSDDDDSDDDDSDDDVTPTQESDSEGPQSSDDERRRKKKPQKSRKNDSDSDE